MLRLDTVLKMCEQWNKKGVTMEAVLVKAVESGLRVSEEIQEKGIQTVEYLGGTRDERRVDGG
jgi:hypothetical protein